MALRTTIALALAPALALGLGLLLLVVGAGRAQAQPPDAQRSHYPRAGVSFELPKGWQADIGRDVSVLSPDGSVTLQLLAVSTPALRTELSHFIATLRGSISELGFEGAPATPVTVGGMRGAVRQGSGKAEGALAIDVRLWTFEVDRETSLIVLRAGAVGLWERHREAAEGLVGSLERRGEVLRPTGLPEDLEAARVRLWELLKDFRLAGLAELADPDTRRIALLAADRRGAVVLPLDDDKALLLALAKTGVREAALECGKGTEFLFRIHEGRRTLTLQGGEGDARWGARFYFRPARAGVALVAVEHW